MSTRNNLPQTAVARYSNSRIVARRLPRALLVTLVAAALIGGAGRTQAEPVTIRFQATVTEAGDFSQSALPFVLEPGDVLAGELVFDSIDDVQRIFGDGSETTQATMTLRFDGIEMFSLFNLGEVGNIFPPPNQALSGLRMGWLPTTDVFPAFSGSYQSNATFGLAGPDGIIETVDDVLDFGKWNELTTARLISLSFGYPDAVLVEAAIGEITVVPEPSSVTLVLLFLILLGRTTFCSLSRSKGSS